VYDATGSMSKHFQLLHSHIRGVLGEICSSNPNLKPRLGLVAYRDPEDGDHHFQVFPFTGSISEFERSLKHIEGLCQGGGDQCEDVIVGLQKADQMDWKHQNRIIFLCGDAPCHGRKYHHGCNDNHPEGLGTESESILHSLITKGVQIIFWKVNDSTDKMIQVFNLEAEKSPKAIFPGDRSRTVGYIASEVMDAREMVNSMRSSILTVVERSISSSSSRVKGKDIKHTLKRATERFAVKEKLPMIAEEIARMSVDDDIRSDSGASI